MTSVRAEEGGRLPLRVQRPARQLRLCVQGADGRARCAGEKLFRLAAWASSLARVGLAEALRRWRGCARMRDARHTMDGDAQSIVLVDVRV
eukprot:365652-Chlamydomonas_euryale.AAC.16